MEQHRKVNTPWAPSGLERIEVAAGKVPHFLGVLETGRFHHLSFGSLLAPLGRLCVPSWRPLDFEGPIRSVLLDVFGATAKTIKNIYLLTTVPLKLENAKQRKT